MESEIDPIRPASCATLSSSSLPSSHGSSSFPSSSSSLTVDRTRSFLNVPLLLLVEVDDVGACDWYESARFEDDLR